MDRKLKDLVCNGNMWVIMKDDRSHMGQAQRKPFHELYGGQGV